jgi:AraC-like DNA-binding protein
MRQRRSGLFLTFLVSYVLVLVVPMLISSLAYVRAARAIAEGVSRAELETLRRVRQAVDASFAGVRRIGWQASLSERVRAFARIEGDLDPRQRLAQVDLVREMRSYAANVPFLHDCFVYFRGSERLITPSAAYEPSLYFEQFAAQRPPGRDWSRFLSSFDAYSKHLPSAVLGTYDGDIEVVISVQSLPMDAPRGSGAVLVALLDARSLRTLVAGLNPSGYVGITAPGGETLLERGERPQRLLVPEGPEQVHWERDRVVLTARSQQTGIGYVSVVPRKVFLAALGRTSTYVLLVLAICLVVGLGVALAMAYRSYLPIRGVADSLAALLAPAGAGPGNEMDFIRQTVLEAFQKNRQLAGEHEKTIVENVRFREMLNRNEALVRNGLLVRLLQGQIRDYEAAAEWLSRYDVTFPHPNLQVALFLIEEPGRSHGREEWALLRFLISALSEELAATQYRAYACELDYDRLALLLNIPGGLAENVAGDDLERLARRIQSFLRTHYGAETTVGIGRAVGHPREARRSYDEAVHAANYRIIEGRNSLIRFDRITERSAQYFYPIEAELGIINTIKAGDSAACERALDEIYHQNFVARRLPQSLARCLVYDMVSTAIKVLDVVRINYVDVFGPDFDPVAQIVDVEYGPETWARIKRIYLGVCGWINEHRRERSSGLKARVLRHIHEHYLDNQLSQTAMAARLGISAPYLSAFFRQEMGESMVEYVNKLRVERAKELLLKEPMSLERIAREVGCGSGRTLIRLFHRYVGVTPRRFRELNEA